MLSALISVNYKYAEKVVINIFACLFTSIAFLNDAHFDLAIRNFVL